MPTAGKTTNARRHFEKGECGQANACLQRIINLDDRRAIERAAFESTFPLPSILSHLSPGKSPDRKALQEAMIDVIIDGNLPLNFFEQSSVQNLLRLLVRSQEMPQYSYETMRSCLNGRYSQVRSAVCFFSSCD